MMAMVDHLRRHVLKSAAKGVSLPLIHVAIGIHVDLTFTSPAKIANLQHVILIYQQVFWLQIPMYETVLVEKVDSCHSLYEKVKCCFFSETTLFLDQNKEITLRDVFHDKVDILLIFQICIHAHNIDMLEFFVNLNFAAQRLLHLWGLDHALVQLLDSYLEPTGSV